MAPDLPPEPPISSSAAVRNKRRYNSSFYSFVLHFYVRFMNSITFYGFSVMDSHFSSCVAVIWRPLSARWGKPVFNFQRAVSSPLSGKKEKSKKPLEFLSFFIFHFSSRRSSQSLQRKQKPNPSDACVTECNMHDQSWWAGTCFSWWTGLCACVLVFGSQTCIWRSHGALSVFVCSDLTHLISVRLPIRTRLLHVGGEATVSQHAAKEAARLHEYPLSHCCFVLFFFVFFP